MSAEENGAAPHEPPSHVDTSPTPPQFPGAPRDLLAAYLLLLLRGWSMHGYQLMQQLMQFGYQTTDPGTIYRQLRQLERQGFIRSSWETGDAGPARRTYTITDAGEAFLQSCAQAIENWQKGLQFWSDLYRNLMNPLMPPPSQPK